MNTSKFYVENPSFIVYTDESKNPDFINNGFFAENEDQAYKIASALIEYNFGIAHALDPHWYVSDGSKDDDYMDPSYA